MVAADEAEEVGAACLDLRPGKQRHLLGRAGLCPSGFLGAQKQGH